MHSSSIYYVYDSHEVLAVSQTAGSRPLIAEARIRSQTSPFGIYGAQSDTGTDFSPECFCFLLSVSFQQRPIDGTFFDDQLRPFEFAVNCL